MPGISPNLLKGEAPLVASTEVVVATDLKAGIPGFRSCALSSKVRGGYLASGARGRLRPAARASRGTNAVMVFLPLPAGIEP